jgi:hypothetical protein
MVGMHSFQMRPTGYRKIIITTHKVRLLDKKNDSLYMPTLYSSVLLPINKVTRQQIGKTL